MTTTFTTQTQFPARFLWGAATAAYEVEGSPLADGAGPSDWHTFSREPGRIADGETGDLACDHYQRRAADVNLMQTLGLRAYRCSVAWGRVLPNGRGTVNAKGLAFYDALIDRLLAADIKPILTIHHWDLPLALAEIGGWRNADMPKWFAEYAWRLYRAFDDRVHYWVTLNEPWVIMHCGYCQGNHPPGRTDVTELPQVARNLLLAHAAAVAAYRGEGHHQIGIAVNIEPKYPYSERPEDLSATRRVHAYLNRQFLDPILLGCYPKTLQRLYGLAEPPLNAEELGRVSAPLDFLGINYTSRAVVRHDPSVELLRASNVPQTERPRTNLNLEVFPLGLTDTLAWVAQRYKQIPVLVTEQGGAYADPPITDGRLQDPARCDYMRRHLLAVRTALGRGADVRGYFAGALFDGFAWTSGYTKRSGIVHVDRATLTRTLKASARFYADVIRTHGACLDSANHY
jgi:beta-glucosidase